MPGEFSSTPFPTFASTTLPARQFDGSTQYVDMGAAALLSIGANAPMALCCWINFATLAGTQTFLGKGFDGTNTAYMFQQGGGALIFGSFGPSVVNGTTWTSTWSTGQWHHCYGDYTGSGGTPASTWRIYIDGGSVATTFNTIGPIVTGRDFVAGAVNSSGGTPFLQLFTGCMADAALFNGPLTNIEISGLAAGSIRPNSSMSQTLLGYWPLNGTSSPEPDNSSGSPNPGTVTGSNPSVCASGPP
jgi:hypothetical protein